jgi:hypothetical protein
VGVREQDLLGDIVEIGGLVEVGGVLGVERAGHEEAVEPHLVRVNLLVPEAAAGGARLLAELVAQGLQGNAVAVGGRLLVEREEDFAGRDRVEGVILLLVAGDGSVGRDFRGDDLRGVVAVGGVAGGVGELEQRERE